MPRPRRAKRWLLRSGSCATATATSATISPLPRFATDLKTLTAREYIAVILRAWDRAGAEVPDPNGRLRLAVTILRDWDGFATTDNCALPILATCLEAAQQAGSRRALARLSPQALVRSLGAVLDRMERRWGSFEVPWGRIHVIRRGDRELPMPGAGNTAAADSFTTLFMAGAAKPQDGRYVTDRGSSWIQLVQYRDGTVEAKTILPFGNSNDPASPHYADQMPLFAARQLKRALLTGSEIEAGATSTKILPYPRE